MKSKLLLMFVLIVAVGLVVAGPGICQQSADGKVNIKQWTNILKSKVSETVGDKGLVNYQEGYIEAVGTGAPPEKYYGKPNARPMALRAAQVDAYRNLLETVQGVNINSQTTVKDFVTESDTINAQVAGIVKSAKIVNREYLNDGTVEVTIRAQLSELMKTVLPTAIVEDQKKDMKDHEPAPFSQEPAREVFTGLVVDARGLMSHAAVSPKILDQNGAEIYGTLIADKDEAMRQGLAGFAADLDEGKNDPRVANRPIIVKAITAEGPKRSDLKISNDDAQKIRSSKDNLAFLKKCRVMIIIEPPDEGGCVSAGTTVTLADGKKKPIESLSVNDRITAYDEKGKKISEARVEKVLKHNSVTYVLHELKTSGQHELLVTGNHPILTKSGGWKPVDDIKPGEVIFILNPQTQKLEETKVAVIIRDRSEKNVVYNLKTSQGSYIANDIIVHNKCLQSGAYIDTPAGPRAVETLKVGDLVYGQKDSGITPVRVLHAYTKTTILPTLPGNEISRNLTVTGNHWLWQEGQFVQAAKSGHPYREIQGAVYDIQTETGNYLSGGILMKAGE